MLRHLFTYLNIVIFFSDGSTEYYSVALIKKDTLKDVYNLGNLKGKKACFAGVGTQAGWNVPINTVSLFVIQNQNCLICSLIIFEFLFSAYF